MALNLFPSSAVVIERDSVELSPITGSSSAESASDLKLETPHETERAHVNTVEAGISLSRAVVDQEVLVPNGGYKWVCVACVFWLNAYTCGISSVGQRF